MYVGESEKLQLEIVDHHSEPEALLLLDHQELEIFDKNTGELWF